ncbi:uncharacterized protein TOT_020000967 [Theileria orientalis strain Shintoku]|uniref:ubiquitinyl hydrolase 1 n=1 Tax=Theileria orientalis strain Shintoku TaxID=869250 RepID=J4C8F8_THEOR|nr:uncharacterized protein TOT_020000967 [Theileria orientalis strain Shintoku]BAM40713.1 uncharacterized protein TOT_020000967 [Theileria orientalis strain Shintoku]|eukprot:XP_009691014.1 uncharacterized protein TOT_020000967 [Theileria orientalis strain Shintoku]
MSWIWKEQSFMEQVCNEFLSFNLGTVVPAQLLSTSASLNAAVNYMVRIINKTLEKNGTLINAQVYKSILKSKEVISTTDSILWQHLQDAVTSAASGNYSLLYGFIFSMINRVRDLQEDEWILVPGGVLLSENTPAEQLSYAVHKLRGTGSYMFVVINTGGLGLKYHSYRVNKGTKLGTLQRDATLVLKDVKPEALLHSAFWFMLYRLLYVPSTHNYEILYTVLLPFLNNKSLPLNWRVDNLKNVKPTQQTAQTTQDDGNKKLLIEAFTQLHESHESKQTKTESARSLSMEINKNLGGVWFDVPVNTYKPAMMIDALSALVEIILLQNGVEAPEVDLVFIMLQLSTCLLIYEEMEKLTAKEALASLGHRSTVLFIQLSCKKLTMMAAESLLSESSKKKLIDIDEDALTIELAAHLSNSIYQTSGDEEVSTKMVSMSGGVNTRKELYSLICYLVNSINKKLHELIPNQLLGMGKGSCTMDRKMCAIGSNFGLNFEFENFGKFRLDGANVNELAKGTVKSLLLLPVELTSVDYPVKDYTDVCKVLRECVQTCTILSNQRDAMPYTYAWRYQLIKHVVLDLLPIPLPRRQPAEARSGQTSGPATNGSDAGSVDQAPDVRVDFWNSMEILRETQLDLLRLLQLLARHLCAVFCSLVKTRPIEGEKAILLAAICSITDAVVRKIAIDTPSYLSLFYSGKSDGPVGSFGFFLGNFANESSYYGLTDPMLVIVRNKVLEYFKSLEPTVDKYNVLFTWENNMEISKGDELLLQLLAVQMGFTRNQEDIRKYYISESSEFSCIFPEFANLRDVAFLAKSIGWSQNSIPLSRYSLEDSTLKYTLNSSSTISVKVFGKSLKVGAIVTGNRRGVNVNYYRKMMKWFSGSSSKNIASAADPHNLTDIEINNETDVLHLSSFPDYGGKLGRRDSEILLQYLTASYVRIPLVTQFFSDEANLQALVSEELQKVVVASIFEPGTWQSSKIGFKLPQTAPVQSRDVLSTSLGLLYNEILNAPNCLLSSIEQMINLTLQRDHQVYTGESSKLLLFITRLTVYISNYIKVIIEYNLDPTNATNRSKEEGDQPEVEVLYDNLFYVPEIIVGAENLKELQVFQARINKLLRESARVLTKRAIKAEQANEHNTAASAMAHVALIYNYLILLKSSGSSRCSTSRGSARTTASESPREDADQLYIKLASCIFFVFVHHQFNVEHYTGMDGELEEDPLCLPDMEMFNIMQTSRNLLLNYFRTTKDVTTKMELLVKVVSQLSSTSATGEATRSGHEEDLWQEILTPSPSGRFTKASAAQKALVQLTNASSDELEIDDVLLESFYVDEEFEDAAQGSWGFDSQVASGIKEETPTAQQQKEEKEKQDKGLVGNTKTQVITKTNKALKQSKSLGKKMYRKLKKKGKTVEEVTPLDRYEAWLKMKVMQHCDVEINFQTAEFSLKKNKLQLLGHWVNKYDHFVDIFGKVTNKTTIQSATVQLHRNRHWLRLTGREYDLIKWEPPEQQYQLTNKTPFKYAKPPKGLEWVTSVMEPFVSQYASKWSFYIDRDVVDGVNNARSVTADSFYDDFEYGEEEALDSVMLYAQYTTDQYSVGSVHSMAMASGTSSVPVEEFYQSGMCKMVDYSGTYVPQAHEGLIRIATDTFNTISNVITDTASTITKLAGTSSSINKEVYLTKSPPCVYVFDIVEVGRTWYRSLCYSSDVTMSFSSSIPRYITTTSTTTSPKKSSIVLGDPRDLSNTSTDESLLIIRHAQSQQVAKESAREGARHKTCVEYEMLILPKLLNGLLPQVLLEEYQFWQNLKTSDLIGYPMSSVQRKAGEKEKDVLAMDPTEEDTSTAQDLTKKNYLQVELVTIGPMDPSYFQQSDARALVSRRNKYTEEVYNLVNLQNTKDATIREFVATLTRLDDLSHVLAWSLQTSLQASNVSPANTFGSDVTPTKIDLIEYAKLGLTFRLDATKANSNRYICDEYNGLYLNYGDVNASPLTSRLIRGLENSLLLSDDDGELYILVSTVRCPMRVYPTVPQSSVAAQTIYNYLLGLGWPELVYDGHNTNWLNNLDSKHYLYKVHTSRCFLFVPTSSSLLYLLMCRFLDRQYEQVCRLSSNMIFDQVQNDESILYWSIISKIDSNTDTHPDAYASRLHILLAANKQGITISKGINILTVSTNKFKKGLSTFKSIFSGQTKSASQPTSAGHQQSKDASPRPGGDDDKIFINWVLHEQLCHYIHLNRLVSAGCKLSIEEELELLSLCQSYYLLNTLKASNNALIREYVVAADVELSVPSKPTVTTFDEIVDRSVIDKNLVIDAATSFTTMRYKKPHEMQSGPNSLEYIDKLLQKGVTISEFMTVYELLLGVFPLTTFPNETTHGWGAMLTRVISYKEKGAKNMMMSTLKVLCTNPGVAAHMPPCPEDLSKKKQFAAMFTRAHQPVHKFMGDLQRVFGRLEENKEITWDSTGRSVNRMEYVIKADPVIPRGTLTTPWMFRSYSTDYGRSEFAMRPATIMKTTITRELLRDMSTQLISDSLLSDVYTAAATTRASDDDAYGFSEKNTLPIDLDKHWIMKYDVCKKYLERLKLEYQRYLKQQEQQMVQMSTFVGFDEQTIEKTLKGDKEQLTKGVTQLTTLKDRLLNLFKSDGQFIETSIKTVLQKSNSITPGTYANWEGAAGASGPEGKSSPSVGERMSKLGGSMKTIMSSAVKGGLSQNVSLNIKNAIKSVKAGEEQLFPDLDYNDGNLAWSFVFGKLAGLENTITFEHLVECLVSTNGDQSLRYLNPFVSDTKEILSLVAAIMLTVNRRIHVAKCISLLLSILQAIRRFYNMLSSGAVASYGRQGGQVSTKEEEVNMLKCEIITSSKLLSEKLKVSRHYIRYEETLGIQFDPRLLLFEFNCGILLYKRQVELVQNFMKNAKSNSSCCHQMIMGEGKTTVVGPLLSLLLADGEKLFVQVCPNSLLEFTRATLRETFSAVIKKNVYTFKFTRFDKATPELYLKLLQAKQTRSVVIATPTSIKSLFLKVVYCFHKLESGELKQDVVRRVNNLHKKLVSIWNMTSTKVVDLAHTTAGGSKEKSKKSKDEKKEKTKEKGGQGAGSADGNDYVYHRDVQLEMDMCLRILELFNNAVLLMDEIDLLLHPLKSELHWPMGQKVPISHLNNSEFQIRWLLPWHILRVLYANPEQQMGKGEGQIYARIRSCIEEAVANSYLSNFPHIILLSTKWYQNELLPLMVEWVYQFLRTKNLLTESYNEVYQYVVNKNVSSSLKTVKVLVFTREWLCSIFPHVIAKVNQVNYGILSLKQIEDGLAHNPNMPQTRRMLAVPFVGKGTPARDSEFSHPDVLIGFTILSTVYQGLRFSDFVLTIRSLCSNFYQEPGKTEFRPSYKLFNRWLNSVGYYSNETARSTGSRNSYHYIRYLEEGASAREAEGRKVNGTTTNAVSDVLSGGGASVLNGVNGARLMSATSEGAKKQGKSEFSESLEDLFGSPKKAEEASNAATHRVEEQPAEVEMDRIWCLDGINVFDNEQLLALYQILKRSTLVMEYYLCKVLFPLAMEYCEMQMTATAQELGSSIMFPTRLGFSGTPSDLLPVEMNGCNFSPGVDGKMIAVTTDEAVVSGPVLLPVGWDADAIINMVATCPQKPLALIDTGALITNYTNYEVAKLLLVRGLSHVEGVVFLDDEDRQMILLRNKWTVTLLAHCGIPLQKRFSFYDQIHSTGQDIKQAARAVAYITIGPDMTFRDFAQGAWRMRGIGQGQTIKIIQPPEINQQITSVTNNKGVLGCICWLLIRGLLNEVRLGRLLIEQCVENIARKKSFQALIQDHLNIGGNVHLGAHVQLFREFRDFSIPNTFAPKVTLNRRILDFSARHQISHTQLHSITSFLNQHDITDDSAHTSNSTDFDIARNKVNVSGPSYSMSGHSSARTSNISQMNKMNQDLFALSDEEDMFETQDQMEVAPRQSHSKEVNDYLGMEITIDDDRSDEDLVYWPLDSLIDANAQLEFLRCRDFYLYRKDGNKYRLPFPEYVTISPNFYKIRWSEHTYRRMKNVLVVVDVCNDKSNQIISQLTDFGQSLEQGLYNQQQQPVAAEAAIPQNVVYDVMKGYEALDTSKHAVAGQGVAGLVMDIDTVLSILHAVDPEGPDEWELICEMVTANLNKYRAENKTNMIGVKDFLSCMNPLYAVDATRKYIVVTLAEAEAIRAWLHKNKATKTKIALRHLAAKFQPFDSSAVYAPKYFDKLQSLVGLQSRIVNSCLRFFNSEIQFSEAQIAILTTVFRNVSPQDRLMFYQNLRETRLVVQNIKVALSCCEILSKVFTSTAIDDFAMRLLGLRFQYLMDQKGGPSCLLSAMKCDRMSFAHMERILSPNPQKPIAKSAEMKAFFTMVDTDCDGVISLEDLQNIYEEPSKPSITKIIASVQFTMVKYKQIRLVASCAALAAFTAKRLTHVKSETAVTSQYFVLLNPKQAPSTQGSSLGYNAALSSVNADSIHINVLMLIRGSGIELFTKPPSDFRMVWKDAREPSLALWEPEAPEGYTSLGLVASTGNRPPRSCVHCVPKKWLEAAEKYETFALEGLGERGEPLELAVYLSEGVLSLEAPRRLLHENFALQQDFFDATNIPAVLQL